MEERFFSHLEGMQVEGAEGDQVVWGGLIESHAPLLTGAKVQEALRYLLTRLWWAHRVPKHHSDIAHQSIVHQSCSIRGQEMPIHRSQTKERETIPPIVANQFCFWMPGLGQLFRWRAVSNLFLYGNHHKNSVL